MEIHEIKTVINAIKYDLRAKYGIDWLDYTLKYCADKKGFIKCEAYIAEKCGIKSDYVYLRMDTNEDFVKKAFELLVKSILHEVRK